jgi:DNA-binding SARP family transcriptional activator
MLRIATFGRLELARDGFAPVGLTQGKPAALLAYLLLKGRAVSREAVAELLWPGPKPDAARLSLRQALFVLRRQLGAVQAQRLIVATTTHLALDPTVPHQSDWALLHAHAAAPTVDLNDSALQEMDAIAAQACGTFLDGLEFKASAEFDHWLHEQRSVAQRALRRLLVRLVDERERRGELDAALHAAGRALELDPTDEAAHLRLMQLQLRSDRADDALRQFELASAVLERELGIAPGEALRDLAARATRALRGSRIVADAERGAAASQRLQLTVLAAQLPPPTGADNPEAAFLERRTLAAELQRIVADHGGCWAQAHGAEFFAYFGYPRPSERSALQAVRAASALRQRCAPPARCASAARRWRRRCAAT